MHIAMVGGLERGEHHYASAAAQRGHSLEVHGGHLAGRGGDQLQRMVERADVVIVVTDVNSHAAVLGARRFARSLGKPCLLVRRFGLARFRNLLGELDHFEERGADQPDWSRLMASGWS
ncbi:MAG TPA: DUF2325 domain-containing protein [Polyangiaceae bacterium]|nr:DUF2325 domain-containing protein [Polyangiaceae bacterium]